MGAPKRTREGDSSYCSSRAVLKLFLSGKEKAAQGDIEGSPVSQKKQEIRFVTLVLHTLCFAEHRLHHAIYYIVLES